MESILQDYKDSSSAVAARKLSASAVAEVVDGILDFFDAFCGKFLLYKVERPQFQQFIMQVS